jgi:hypothetical protein
MNLTPWQFRHAGRASLGGDVVALHRHRGHTHKAMSRRRFLGAQAAVQRARGTVDLAHAAPTTDLRRTVNAWLHSPASPSTQGIVRPEQRRDSRTILDRVCATRHRRWRLVQAATASLREAV